ncbi:electron transfer flavoprotein subunit beta/FixA family protein [Thermodesulfobacteriota bacterium]
MNIIVTIKQVPDTQEIKIDPKTGTLIREGAPTIINPEDKNALEEALRLKETLGDATVIALSMGPPQAKSVLREAFAMGADQAVLVSDPAFAGSDTLATSYVLSMAIKKIKTYGLILCGRQAIDGDTAQVGPQIAEFLKIPQVTYAQKIDIEQGLVTVKSNFGKILRTVKVEPPALITVTSAINKPRYKTLNGIWRAFEDNEILQWSQEDLELNPMRIGLNGSPTWVRKISTPVYNRSCLVNEGEPEKLAEGMLQFLADNNYIST